MVGEVVVTPDSYFWYALSITLCVALIWILIRYANKIDKTFDTMSANLKLLTETQIVHGVKIEGHDKDITEIKRKIDGNGNGNGSKNGH